MMKKIKNMKKNTVVSIAMVLVFAILLTSGAAVFNWSGAATQKKATTTAKVKKPGQVKNLKKVKISTKYYKKKKNSLNCQAICSAQIKFSKVKGATGYQVLVYNAFKNRNKNRTPLVFEFNTKKTTYTIQNLVPEKTYTIKVRAYKKDKNGKIVYGKAKSLKIKTSGKKKGCYFVCNSCGVCMPGNGNLLAKHIGDVDKLYKELHAGFTYYCK